MEVSVRLDDPSWPILVRAAEYFSIVLVPVAAGHIYVARTGGAWLGA